MIHAPSLRVGRAHFTMVKEILPGEEVLVVTFFLFEHPIIILFDSGASHDFISLACAQKAKLTLWTMKASYSICMPGGQMEVDRMVRPIPVELVG
jgi:hypothetical protein